MEEGEERSKTHSSETGGTQPAYLICNFSVPTYTVPTVHST